jgi:hypothetical protein
LIFETEEVPAGWLIEQAGFKGKRFGDANQNRFGFSELWQCYRQE